MSDVLVTATGPDGALGAADTGQAPLVRRGSVTRKAGRIYPAPQSPGSYVVWDAGVGGEDARLSVRMPQTGGGGAVYFREVDTANYWRVGIRRYSYSYVSGSYTTPLEYEWIMLYNLPVTHDYNDMYGMHNFRAWSSDPNNNPWGYGSGAYIPHSHYLAGSYYPGDNPPHGHSPSIYRSGNTRGGQTVYQYATAVAYQVVLQKVVQGVTTTVERVETSDWQQLLEVLVLGNKITLRQGRVVREVTDAAHAGATRHGVGYFEDTEGSNSDGLDDFQVLPYNTPPLPPQLTSPRNNVPVNRQAPIRLVLVPRDNDTGDTISRTDWRWKVAGAATWQPTLEQRQPLAYIELPAGTFPEGRVEWQAQTYDRTGAVSGWSGSEFFQAGTPGPGATWLNPVTGQTIGQDPFPVSWSVDDQVAYRVRTVPDVNGQPDNADPAPAGYFDSGVVQSATARELQVRFRTNNRAEHVQVMVQGSNGLWQTTWTSSRVQVSYTRPHRALLALSPVPERAAIRITIVDPAPGPGMPAPRAHDVYVRPAPTPDLPPGPGERIATDVQPSSTLLYRFPESRREFEVLVTTLGANDTTELGAWTGKSTVADPNAGGNLYDSATYDSATYA